MKSNGYGLTKLMQVTAIFAVLILSLSGCSKGSSNNDSNNTVQSYSKKWKTFQAGRDYLLTFQESYYGVHVFETITIEVDGATDEIVRAIGIDSGDNVIEITGNLEHYMTMNEVFKEIERIKALKPATLQVEYDEFNAVQAYYVDYSLLIADDEYGYAVIDLQFK